MVNDKSFGIVSQELVFSILRDCDIGGRRVFRGLFCPVQLISPKIIPPVGEGGGLLLNNVLYYMVTHHPMT